MAKLRNQYRDIIIDDINFHLKSSWVVEFLVFKYRMLEQWTMKRTIRLLDKRSK